MHAETEALEPRPVPLGPVTRARREPEEWERPAAKRRRVAEEFTIDVDDKEVDRRAARAKKFGGGSTEVIKAVDPEETAMREKRVARFAEPKEE